MYYLQRYLQSLYIVFGLLVLLSACGQPLSNRAGSVHITPIPTPAQTEATQSCPAPGSARAAVMPAMPAGNHPNIIYSSESTATNVPYDATTLWRYDTTTAAAKKLVTGNISRSAGISPDGQWVLLTAAVENQWAIQLIRMDSQQLQTLYCAPGLDELLFSPDQRSLAFVWENSDPNVKTFGATVYTLDLLNLATGKLQTLYAGHGISDLLFSPDQRSLVFVEGTDPNSRAPLIMDILDLTTGKHHAVLSAQQADFPKLAQWQSTAAHASLPPFFSSREQGTDHVLSSGGWNSLIPLKWMSNNSLLIRFGMLGSPGSVLRLYLLHDTSKDASQQQNNLQYIAANDDPHDPCEDFDVTPDNQQIVCSHYDSYAGYPGEKPFPSVIKIRPIAGGPFHTIYHGPVGSVSVEVISNSTLLITDPTQILWKMNIDGSGQTQLMAIPMAKEHIQSINCNSSLYALTMYSVTSDETTLVFGSLAGGAPKTVVATQDILILVGWTRL